MMFCSCGAGLSQFGMISCSCGAGSSHSWKTFCICKLCFSLSGAAEAACSGLASGISGTAGSSRSGLSSGISGTAGSSGSDLSSGVSGAACSSRSALSSGISETADFSGTGSASGTSGSSSSRPDSITGFSETAPLSFGAVSSASGASLAFPDGASSGGVSKTDRSFCVSTRMPGTAAARIRPFGSGRKNPSIVFNVWPSGNWHSAKFSLAETMRFVQGTSASTVAPTVSFSR